MIVEEVVVPGGTGGKSGEIVLSHRVRVIFLSILHDFPPNERHIDVEQCNTIVFVLIHPEV
jgi:hypothetical protein